FDKVGGDAGARQAHGEISFDEEILGIILTPEHLNATHGILGLASTDYPSSGHQGPELNRKSGRSFTLSEDRRTLTLEMACAQYADNIRVVTAAQAAVKPG